MPRRTGVCAPVCASVKLTFDTCSASARGRRGWCARAGWGELERERGPAATREGRRLTVRGACEAEQRSHKRRPAEVHGAVLSPLCVWGG